MKISFLTIKLLLLSSEFVVKLVRADIAEFYASNNAFYQENGYELTGNSTNNTDWNATHDDYITASKKKKKSARRDHIEDPPYEEDPGKEDDPYAEDPGKEEDDGFDPGKLIGDDGVFVEGPEVRPFKVVHNYPDDKDPGYPDYENPWYEDDHNEDPCYQNQGYGSVYSQYEDYYEDPCYKNPGYGPYYNVSSYDYRHPDYEDPYHKDPDYGYHATTTVKTPDKISEDSGISGELFTETYINQFNYGNPLVISEDEASGTQLYSRSETVRQARILFGVPVVRENFIQITIPSSPPEASSTANRIRMWFGRSRVISLLGLGTQNFPLGVTITWDLNSVKAYLETIGTDLWDWITLEIPDTDDGLKIENVRIVHSGVEILNWDAHVWLDRSKEEQHTYLGLTAKILEHKLNAINNEWITQIHYAARELGKTYGYKYGANYGAAWCSEFASWCLRFALWDTPEGNIGSQAMEDYFASIGRKHDQSELFGSYPGFILKTGDYLRFEFSNGGKHSGLFIEYIDPLPYNPSTRILTIEGNTGSRVAIRIRTLQQVLSVGNTQ